MGTEVHQLKNPTQEREMECERGRVKESKYERERDMMRERE
jgi:hypothetical protein